MPTDALVGYYGDGDKGNPGDPVRLDWGASGRLLSMHPNDGISGMPEGRTALWTVGSTTEYPTRRGFLKVTGTVFQSEKGDLFCAQASRSTDPVVASVPRRIGPGDLVCYRWEDRIALWRTQVPLQEEWLSGVFLSGDAYIAIAAMRDRQGMVILLDAKTGKELQRTLFPGLIGFSQLPLAVNDDGLFVTFEQDGEAFLSKVSLPDLALTPISGEYPAGKIEIMGARNAKTLLLLSHYDYQVLRADGESSTVILSGTLTPEYEVEVFTTGALSVDGRYAFVASQCKSKLLDVEGRKVRKSLALGAGGSAFSADGRSLAICGEDGLELRDPVSGELHSKAPAQLQPSVPIQSIRYINGDKMLLVADYHCLWLWDTSSRKIAARLTEGRAPAMHFNFNSLAVINNGTQLISADALDFLIWDLPPQLQAGPSYAEVKPKQAFPGLPGEKERMNNVATDRSGTHVLSFSSGRKFDVKRRRVDNLAIAEEITCPPQFSPLIMTSTPTSVDGEIRFSFESDTARWLHITQDSTEAKVLSSWGAEGSSPVGVSNEGTHSLHLDYQTQTLKVIEVQSGKPTSKLRVGKTQGRFVEAFALSADGALVAGVFSDDVVGSLHLLLFDVKTQALVGSQRLLLGAVSLAFSKDSSRIACAHNTHTISEWNVEKLRKNPLPSFLNTKSEVVPATPPIPPPDGPKVDYLTATPTEPRIGSDGIPWQFLPNGSVSIGHYFPRVATLKIDGKEVQQEGTKLRLSSGIRLSMNMVQTECSTPSAQLWVSRLFDYPKGRVAPTFLDVIENTSSSESFAGKVTFEVQFPTDTQQLMSDARTELKVGPSGIVEVPEGAAWIAPKSWGKPGDALPMCYFTNPSAQISPELHWNGSTCVLTVAYQVTIPAGHRRYLVHRLQLQGRDPKVLQDVFDAPHMPDFSSTVLPVVRDLGINFGRLRQSHLDALAYNDDWVFEPKTKDPAGFIWTMAPGMSMTGEHGRSNLFSMSINGRPLGYCNSSVYPSSEKETTTWRLNEPGLRNLRGLVVGGAEHPGLGVVQLEAHDIDQSIDVTRLPPKNLRSGVTGWVDHFSNKSETPVTLDVTYRCAFQTSPVNWWDASGGEAELGDKVVTGKQLGGACLIEHPGNQRPSTWIGFHWGDSPVVPDVRWSSQMILSLTYKITVPPRGRRVLALNAAQTLLGATEDSIPKISQTFSTIAAPPKWRVGQSPMAVVDTYAPLNMRNVSNEPPLKSK